MFANSVKIVRERHFDARQLIITSPVKSRALFRVVADVNIRLNVDPITDDGNPMMARWVPIVLLACVALAPADAAAASRCYSARATCDDKILPANGWWIDQVMGKNDCIWKRHKNPLAFEDSRTAINEKWKSAWYPKWKAQVQAVFARFLPRLQKLTAQGIKAEWWFEVEVNADGTVGKVDFQEPASGYSPKGGPYDNVRFRLDRDDLIKALNGAKAPAFPDGSLRTAVTMPVGFHNRKTGTVDVPADVIPQEPETEAEPELLSRSCE
jgi:hypothetical protein